jgi:hypothetical protein
LAFFENVAPTLTSCVIPRCATHVKAPHDKLLVDGKDGDWFYRQEGFDRLDGVLVFIEIPHPAVAARIEDGVGVFLLDALKANDSVRLSFRSDVLFRSDRKVSSEFRFAEQ